MTFSATCFHALMQAHSHAYTYIDSFIDMSGRYLVSGVSAGCVCDAWDTSQGSLALGRKSSLSLSLSLSQCIYVATHFAPVGPWVMSGTAFWVSAFWWPPAEFSTALWWCAWCHADIGVAQRPEGCLCSHIGHLYRGLDTKTDSSS